MSSTLLTFFDLETTGLIHTETTPNIILDATIRSLDSSTFKCVTELHEKFSNMGQKLSIGCRVATGIKESDLVGLKDFKDSDIYKYFQTNKELENNIFVSYNGVGFDHDVLEQPRYGIHIKRMIDMYIVAKSILDDRKSELEDSFKLGHVRYWIQDQEIFPALTTSGSHNSTDDVAILEYVFKGLVKYYSKKNNITNFAQIIYDWEMLTYNAKQESIEKKNENERFIVEKRVPYKKHAGKLIAETPVDYLEWCLENISNMDIRLKVLFEERVSVVRGTKKVAEIQTSLTIDTTEVQTPKLNVPVPPQVVYIESKIVPLITKPLDLSLSSSTVDTKENTPNVSQTTKVIDNTTDGVEEFNFALV